MWWQLPESCLLNRTASVWEVLLLGFSFTTPPTPFCLVLDSFLSLFSDLLFFSYILLTDIFHSLTKVGTFLFAFWFYFSFTRTNVWKENLKIEKLSNRKMSCLLKCVHVANYVCWVYGICYKICWDILIGTIIWERLFILCSCELRKNPILGDAFPWGNYSSPFSCSQIPGARFSSICHRQAQTNANGKCVFE